MALLALDTFIFELKTIPFQSRKRSTKQRWSSTNRVGQAPAHQYIGPGDDDLSLEGVLYPEISGGAPSIEKVRVMAAKGEPLLMVDDNGYLRGWWIIESVDETGSDFFEDGTARKIEFSIALKRTDKPTTSGGSTVASLV